MINHFKMVLMAFGIWKVFYWIIFELNILDIINWIANKLNKKTCFIYAIIYEQLDSIN